LTTRYTKPYGNLQHPSVMTVLAVEIVAGLHANYDIDGVECRLSLRLDTQTDKNVHQRSTVFSSIKKLRLRNSLDSM